MPRLSTETKDSYSCILPSVPYGIEGRLLFFFFLEQCDPSYRKKSLDANLASIILSTLDLSNVSTGILYYCCFFIDSRYLPHRGYIATTFCEVVARYRRYKQLTQNDRFLPHFRGKSNVTNCRRLYTGCNFYICSMGVCLNCGYTGVGYI